MPASDRSIRNITIKHRDKGPDTPVPPPPKRARPRSRGFWPLLIIVVLVAAGLGLLLSTIFAGATVTVTPKEARVTLPSSILAQLNGPVGTLPYKELSTVQSATSTVPAKDTKYVERQAKGTLTITSALTTPQRLIANTRFQAPEGKIYRIRESVVVPAQGTVTAVAYADSAGADYNRGQTTFTIPGFKGDPRYDKISATTQSMTGGFIGREPSIATSDLSAAKKDLDKKLLDAVQTEFARSLPSGYAPIQGALKATYSELSQTQEGSDSAAVSESITATLAIVRIADVASAVARLAIPSYQGEALTFKDFKEVNMIASSTSASAILVSFSGEATLQWIFDADALKAAIVGKQKSEFEGTIRSFGQGVESAHATTRPFWASTFPKEPEKITIIIKK